MTLAHPVLALVGGGAVATALVHELTQLTARGGRLPLAGITVFEPAERLGCGQAYEDDTATNLLNTRAAGISAVHGNPNHFYHWLTRNETDWRAAFPAVTLRPDAYLPRALFGRYLHALLAEDLARLQASGVAVTHVRQKVVALHWHVNGHTLQTEDGAVHNATRTVLAPGHQQSQRFEHLRHHSGWFASPYPCHRLAREIGRDEPVAILGSGPSALDAVLALDASGHRGPLTLISRRGHLPRVAVERPARRRLRPWPRTFVEQLVRLHGGRLPLAQLGMELFDAITCQPTQPETLGRLRTGAQDDDLGDADAQARDEGWLRIVACLTDVVDLVWHHLSVADRRIVDRDFRPHWQACRMPIAPDSARRVQALLDAGRLAVHRGCLDVQYDPDAGRFDIELDDRNSGTTRLLHTHCVVNAAGFTTDLRECGSPLLRQLLATGQAREHEFGGLEVDFASSQVLDHGGRTLSGLYALGSVTSGTYGWTHAMSVNARLATDVARHLLAPQQPVHREPATDRPDRNSPAGAAALALEQV